MRPANPEFGEVAAMSSACARTIHGGYEAIKPWLDFALARPTCE
ncbi:MAG: hypothetical protein ACLQGP_38470 [Isosphaeraceae bacterium]